MNSRQKFLHIALSAVFAFASALSPGAQAQQAGSEVGGSPALSDSELTFLLQQQEKRFETRFQAQEEALTQQRQLLERQQAAMATQAETIEALKARIDEIGSGTRARPTDTDEQQREIDAQREAIATQTAAIQALQTQFDQFTQDQQRTLSETDQQIRARLESLEGTMVGLQEQETTSTYDASEFPGAFQVPGTSAALKVGGFVKANVVQNFDGLTQQQNRFIVGFIPTRGEFTDDAEANLNVRQSRINLEYRQDTERGQLRAFIEGDFAGDGDTFRLRHAFGQFQDLLAGKYWSNFMDVDSSPEEVDFEGVNGRINTRQTQVRYFPEFGNGWNLILSAEDTQADVTGGEALSIYPDLVASIRRTLRDAWNVKFSVMFRSLEARWEEDESVKKKETGLAFSVSGRRNINWWDPRDNFTLQLSFGEGFGRYVNDLGSVGGQDAVFDDTGNFKALEVFAGYMSFQKWWRDGLRSNVIFSVVEVDTYDFQDDEAYDNTWRFSTNLIWSPVPAIDIGGELLWGGREDKDGSSGDASQAQLSIRYRF